MKKIEEFAKKRGLDGVEDKHLVWQGYKVYRIYRVEFELEGGDVHSTGYPAYVLEKDGEVRSATMDEVLDIMDALIERMDKDA